MQSAHGTTRTRMSDLGFRNSHHSTVSHDIAHTHERPNSWYSQTKRSVALEILINFTPRITHQTCGGNIKVFPEVICHRVFSNIFQCINFVQWTSINNKHFTLHYGRFQPEECISKSCETLRFGTARSTRDKAFAKYYVVRKLQIVFSLGSLQNTLSLSQRLARRCI